jgi:hypothetical protein
MRPMISDWSDFGTATVVLDFDHMKKNQKKLISFHLNLAANATNKLIDE